MHLQTALCELGTLKPFLEGVIFLCLEGLVVDASLLSLSLPCKSSPPVCTSGGASSS